MIVISVKCPLTLLVATCIGTAGSIVFQPTSCSSTESLIARLYGVSFSTCAEECEKRVNCSLYNYRTRLHSCELLSQNGSKTTKTIGCVVGLKPTSPVRKGKCSPIKDSGSEGGPGRKKECLPLSVPRATVFGNVWTIGSKAAIICDSDKTYYTTKCQENGTWEALPTCPVCGTAPKVPNAVSSGTGPGELGAVLTFACNEGYSAPVSNNNFNVTCQDNGNWTDVEFRCKRNCSDPTKIDNATLNDGDTLEGAERTYTCFNKFTTSTGSNVISVTCTNTGEWTAPNESCTRNTCSLETIGSRNLLICKESKTHDEATEECDRFGELVRIDTLATHTEISSVLRNGAHGHDYWIQGKYDTSDGAWKFNDGTIINVGMFGDVWIDNDSSHYCVRLHHDENYEMHDINCDKRDVGYICTVK